MATVFCDRLPTWDVTKCCAHCHATDHFFHLFTIEHGEICLCCSAALIAHEHVSMDPSQNDFSAPTSRDA